MDVTLTWRGEFSNDELNTLHAEAFGHRVYSNREWDWLEQVGAHSLGWVTARSSAQLVGFVNVIWDGFVHAWIQDTMVAKTARGREVGTRLVAVATEHARSAGCEWLHVDFDEELAPFYLDACGFTRTGAGLIDLT